MLHTTTMTPIEKEAPTQKRAPCCETRALLAIASPMRRSKRKLFVGGGKEATRPKFSPRRNARVRRRRHRHPPGLRENVHPHRCFNQQRWLRGRRRGKREPAWRQPRRPRSWPRASIMASYRASASAPRFRLRLSRPQHPRNVSGATSLARHPGKARCTRSSRRGTHHQWKMCTIDAWPTGRAHADHRNCTGTCPPHLIGAQGLPHPKAGVVTIKRAHPVSRTAAKRGTEAQQVERGKRTP